MENTAIRKCPFCAEEVKADAIICKSCGHQLNRIQLSKSKRLNIFAATTIGYVLLLSILCGGIGLFLGKALVGNSLMLDRDREERVIICMFCGAAVGTLTGVFLGRSSARRQIENLETKVKAAD